jgi:diacylglycerol kinase (ATP)
VNLAVLYNPSSGRGRGESTASAVASALRSRGHIPHLIRVGRGLHAENELATALAGSQAVVIIGGDGTVHHAAEAAIAANTPIYQIPTGNENLFAREFGMTGAPDQLLAALDRRQIVNVDLGRVSLDAAPANAHSRLFLLMCSLGPDSSVIHRLAKVRDRAVGHWMYARPIVAELCRPLFPRLTIRVDGNCIAEDRPGMLVVANSRQYAWRIDPATRASMTDGLLDAVFLPCCSRTRILRWMLAARLRRHTRDPSLIYQTGREITVTTTAKHALIQLDGEAVTLSGSGPIEPVPASHTLRLRVQPASLPVLLP